jgi:cation:H+ antiporter
VLLALLAVVSGIAVLAVAADQFVIGAARVALIKNVPALVVGVVIIGFGTSAPEILVSALAAIDGEPDVAVGNIIGSNIANLSLLLGIGALIVPLAVDSRTVRREALMVVGAVTLFGVFVQGGGIGRFEGIVLLAAMAAALFVITRTANGDPLGPEAEEFADAIHHRFGPEVVRTVVGLVFTIVAGRLLLWGALDLADRAGLSAGFVGATLVSLGTSLPELVTVVQAARRSETDLIVGNLLGSNLFNALAAGGIVGLIGAPSFDDTSLTTIAAAAAIGVAVAATLSMRTRFRVSRGEGLLLATAYVVIVPFLA